MYNVDIKGRFHFTPLSCLLGNATVFGNLRGPCNLKDPLSLRLPFPNVPFPYDSMPAQL